MPQLVLAINIFRYSPNVPWGTKLPHLRTTSLKWIKFFLIFILKKHIYRYCFASQLFHRHVRCPSWKEPWKSCGPNHTRRWENKGWGPLKQLWSEERQKPMIPSSRSGYQEDRRTNSPQVFTKHLLVFLSKGTHFNLMEFSSSMCCFMGCAAVVLYLRNTYLNCVTKILPCFCLPCFITSGFTLRSMIHFDLIFVYSARYTWSSFAYIYISNWASIIF